MSMVKVPFIADKDQEQYMPWREAVAATAQCWNLHEADVHLLALIFFQSVADELAHKNEVRVPGFGKWRPKQHDPKKPDLVFYRRVFFHAARRLRRDIAESMFSNDEAMKQFTRYRKTNALWNDKRRAHRRATVVMEAAIRQIVATCPEAREVFPA